MNIQKRLPLIVLLVGVLTAFATARPTRKLAFFLACDSTVAWQRDWRLAMVERLQEFRDEHDISRYALPILTYYVDDPTTGDWCAHLGIHLTDTPVAGLGQARRYVVVRVSRRVNRIPATKEGIESAFRIITDVHPAGPAAPPLIPMLPLPGVPGTGR